MPFNLIELLRRNVEHQPDQPAILGPKPEAQLSYKGLLDEIQAMAALLKQAGVRPGAAVGLHLASGRDYIVMSYAIWECGACVVPIAVELSVDEKQIICQQISMTHIVSHSATVAAVDRYRADESLELRSGMEVFAMNSPRTHPAEFEGINAAFIRFSSGTTGASKGVVLSHDTIQERIAAANEVLQIGPEDRVVWLLSMSYHFAVSIVAYLSYGSTIILPETSFAISILQATSRHRGTLMYGSPMIYDQLARDRRGFSLESLRLAISTTTGLTREVGQNFSQRFGLPLTQAYGIIEVGLPCINLNWADIDCEAVGNVLPAYELALHDPNESGIGEIKLRGKGFLDAYYDPWHTRDAIMKDGWFFTGDLGQLDDQGRVVIRGRSKEVISVAGMKFFPQEVESVLKSHLAVANASIYAHPHPKMGEVPHADVVLRSDAADAPSEQTLRDHCRAHLAAFKVPEQINFVDSVRLTASGKVIRREMQPAR